MFGATGETGIHVLSYLLDRHYHVTAIVRNVSKVPRHLMEQYGSLEESTKGQQLQIVEANVLEPRKYESYISSDTCDAVVSCLGFDSLKATTVLSEGMKHIVSCMKMGGVQRILVISSAGCTPDDAQFGWFVRWIAFPYIMHECHEELKRMEQVLLDEAPYLQYTILRPPQLVNRPLTEVYRARVGGLPEGGLKIGRCDLAYAMANMLELDQFKNSIVYVSN